MKKCIGVGYTNEKNLYGEIIPNENIIYLYKDNYKNKYASFLNHDHSTEPIAYTEMLGIYLESGLMAQTIYSNFAEKIEELNYIKYIHKENLDKLIMGERNSFDMLISKLKPNLSSNYKKIFVESIAIYDKNIVSNMFPELIKKMDNEGLINISEFKVINSGLYEYNNFIIYANKFFRRGCFIGNAINSKLLYKLESLSSDKNIDIKISIDLDMIGLIGSEKCLREYDYIFGPKFNNNLNSIKDNISLHKFNDDERCIYGIDKVEFYWNSRKDIKIFECEEITNDELDKNKNIFRNRYVHSIIKLNEEKPFHLDGAIKEYDVKGYMDRIDKKITDKVDSNVKYKKLWRLDGKIEVDLWKDLISSFYYENKLVGEYFGGEDLKLSTKYSYKEYSNSLNGLITHIRFLDNKCNKVDGDYDIIINPGYLLYENCIIPYYEFGSYNFIKKLKQLDIKIKYDDKAIYIDFKSETEVINYPVFECNKLEMVKLIENKFSELYNLMCDDIFVSYSIIAKYDTKSVLYSFAGNIKEFKDFYKSNICIPNCENEIDNYINNLYNYLNNNHAKCNNLITKYLDNSGILSFRRFIVDDDSCEMCIEDNGVFLIPKQDKLSENILSSLTNKSISLSLALKIDNAICSQCGDNYFNCSHISFFDSGVYTNIKRFTKVGIFLTGL